MENQNLFEYISQVYDKDYVEEDEIDKIIKFSKEMKEKPKGNPSNIQIDKTFDWLNFFFPDPDIKEAFGNNNRIKGIICLQCLYFLNIFKSLFLAQFKQGKKSIIEVCDNELNLPLLVLKGPLSKHQDKKKQSVVSIADVKSIEKPINQITIGVIGCGNIGNFLVRHLIAIKDSSIINFRLIVSTRRPNNVHSDILNSLDDNIELCLDNDKVFKESNLIYLCLLHHQLDLLIKEVQPVFKERMEKIKRKKHLLFPTIVSTICGMPVDRLKTLFGEEVNIIRTVVNPTILKKYDETNYYNKFYNSDSNNILDKINSKYDSLNFINERPTKGGVFIYKEVVRYSEESFAHLFKDNEMVEVIIKSFQSGFYSVRKKTEISDSNFYNLNSNPKFTLKVEDKLSNELLMSIFGEDSHDIINTHFFFKNNSFKMKEDQNLQAEVIKRCSENYIKTLRIFFRTIEN